MEQEIADLKKELKQKDSTIRYLKNVNTELERQLKSQPAKIHNERGAGRKSKITSEMIAEIKALRQKNLSFSQIAKVCSQSSGVTISKSSVYKIIMK